MLCPGNHICALQCTTYKLCVKPYLTFSEQHHNILLQMIPVICFQCVCAQNCGPTGKELSELESFELFHAVKHGGEVLYPFCGTSLEARKGVSAKGLFFLRLLRRSTYSS